MRLSIICLIIIHSVLLLTLSPTFAQEPNGIVASVNNEIITREDMLQVVAPTERILRSQFANDPRRYAAEMTRATEDALNYLIERKLILREFEQKGYVLPEDVIDDYVDERISEDFDDRLDFVKTLEANGTTFEAHRQQMREQYIVEALSRQNVSSDVVIISPYKIQRYYLDHKADYEMTDQVKLRMIVISGSKHGDRARPFAEEIISKLNNGTPFAELARIYSDDSNATLGGDWGWVEKGTFREDMSDIIFSLKPGEHSGIVEVGSDLYIMLVEEKKAGGLRRLSEVEDEIETLLINEERNRRRQQWIDSLKKKSYIQYY